MPVAPAAISVIIDETAKAGRLLLTSLEAQGKSAGREGVQAVDEYRAHMTELLSRKTGGLLSALDFARACESYGEALEFQLVSIANEFARSQMQNLLGTSAQFLGNILGVGLKVLGG